MTQIIEPHKDPDGKTLVECLESNPEWEHILLFFWHGLGDAVMFLGPLRDLRCRFFDRHFDVTVEENLGQEDIISGAIPITIEEATEINEGQIPEQFADYDLIAKINMPMSEGQEEYTKAEWCCIKELGIDPVAGHSPIANIAKLVAVHFQLTALPESGGVPYDIAKQIWTEIEQAGYTPMETLMKHKWHNPVNEKYDFVDSHLRDWTPRISTLAAIIKSCKAYIGSLGGNFHLALSLLPPERIIALERDFTVPMYTKKPIKRVSVKEYENGTVGEWLEELL